MKTGSDVAVVGGGLAGLAASTYAARAGLDVTLFEQSEHLGGRAQTSKRDGFAFNLGPHALYRDGAATRVLHELGVVPQGVRLAPSGWFAVDRGVLHTFPTGLISTLTTGLLSLNGKLTLGRVLSGLSTLDTSRLRGKSAFDWVEAQTADATAQGFLHALIRLVTYTDDPHVLCAAAAVEQLRLSIGGGVLYLHHGWSALVNALARSARTAGVKLSTASPVTAIEHDGARPGVRLRDGGVHFARSIIVTAGPEASAALLEHTTTVPQQWRSQTPVKLASLDVALSGLPVPRSLFALGIDRPLYYSVHSQADGLAPAGGAVIHVAKYLRCGRVHSTNAVRDELETFLEALQPGWRRYRVVDRFLPNLTVSNGLVSAASDGAAGRPSEQIANLPWVYLAGDWIGREGQLSDASLASARSAAQLVIQRSRAHIYE